MKMHVDGHGGEFRLVCVGSCLPNSCLPACLPSHLTPRPRISDVCLSRSHPAALPLRPSALGIAEGHFSLSASTFIFINNDASVAAQRLSPLKSIDKSFRVSIFAAQRDVWRETVLGMGARLKETGGGVCLKSIYVKRWAMMT